MILCLTFNVWFTSFVSVSFIYDASDTFVPFMSTRVNFSAVCVYLLCGLLNALHCVMNFLWRIIHLFWQRSYPCIYILNLCFKFVSKIVFLLGWVNRVCPDFFIQYSVNIVLSVSCTFRHNTNKLLLLMITVIITLYW